MITSSTPPVEHPGGFRARRGVNWVFLGLMYGFFYMSRYNFSAISDAIGEKFGWSNTQFGNIITAGVFVYGLSVFLNGPIADKIGGKRAVEEHRAAVDEHARRDDRAVLRVGPAELLADGHRDRAQVVARHVEEAVHQPEEHPVDTAARAESGWVLEQFHLRRV